MLETLDQNIPDAAPIIMPKSTIAPIIQPAPESQKTFLTDITTKILSSYKEYTDGGNFTDRFIAPSAPFINEIRKAFNKFKINFRTNNSSRDFPEWGILDTPNRPYQEYKLPFVQKFKVDAGSKFCFMGDIHGSVHSLLRCLWRLVALGYLDKNLKIIAPDFYMIFLGDYVDRGRYGLETLYILTKLKNKNWDKVFLIRGNHEAVRLNAQSINYSGGFFDEIEQKIPNYSDLFRSIIAEIYQRLPLALYIVINQNVIKCMHGGFAPYGYYFDENIRSLADAGSLFYPFVYLERTDKDSPGFQWCDFEQGFAPGIKDILDAGGRIWKMNELAAEEKLKQAKIKAVFRGHQHHKFGMKMLFSSSQLPTIQELPSENISGLYHWTTVLTTTAKTGESPLQEHGDNPEGFPISHYLPIFTFSSAPEGVGSDFDCFGILTTHRTFTDWRLKIYEFGFPRGIKTNYESWYVTMRKKIHPSDGEVPNGAGRTKNPMAETYNTDTQTSETENRRLLGEV